MGCAEVISLDEVRASQSWHVLRQDLHNCFDQWLDGLQEQLPELDVPLAQISECIWQRRQELTGGLMETIVAHAHADEQHRQQRACSRCHRKLSARDRVSRTVETMIGTVQLDRPYFYCRPCRLGHYPLDDKLGLSKGRFQLDVQQAAAELAIELSYEEAARCFGRLSGVSFSSERMHTLTHQVAKGLSVLDIAPSREAIDRLVSQVAVGRFRRPVMVLGIDGAYVPSRPESARGSRLGQGRKRARRARWKHEWREAKGFRFYLLDGDRIVHVLSWHRVQSKTELGDALKEVKEAGLIPEDTVRLCVVCDGADWIWEHVEALFPSACQVLDYYHYSEYLHRTAKVQYDNPLQVHEWVEMTLARLYLGHVGRVLSGLKRMKPSSEEAQKAIDNCGIYLRGHRKRTCYRTYRRGGYPLGGGGMESANKFICHARLKRSGAWWYETNSNQMLALRCAKYNGTFDQVFSRYQNQQSVEVRTA